MKNLKSTVMVFFWVVLCSLFFNSYSNSYAQAPVGNEIWKLISPPPDYSTESYIIAVHKVSDNNFYILSEGSSLGPAISGMERNKEISISTQLYQYLNGTWTLVTFDPNHVPLYGIGGKGSTVYAVGFSGSVYRIIGTKAELWNSWNALYSDVDLHDVYVADDGTVYAVGRKNNMVGFEPCAFQNNGLNKDWIELPFSDRRPDCSYFTKMSGNGGHQFAAVGESTADPYNIAYFFSNGGLVPISLPPGCSNGYLHAVDYYLNTYRMAGDTGGVIEFSPERSATSCMDGTFDPYTSIRGLYDNFAVGGDYPSMMIEPRGNGLLNGKIFQYINGEWREDPDCPEGFGMFLDIDGGSDIYVVGAYGAILSRDQQASALVPTLSQWGMIIFLMAFITMGLIALRRKNASFSR